jgi:hypothetical protein
VADTPDSLIELKQAQTHSNLIVFAGCRSIIMSPINLITSLINLVMSNTNLIIRYSSNS